MNREALIEIGTEALSKSITQPIGNVFGDQKQRLDKWHLDRCREHFKAALAAIQSAGWAVVPAEPTDDICHAVDHINNQLENRELKAIYKAMIAASPAAEKE